MADVESEPAGPAEAERRSVRTTLALIVAALADCPAEPAAAAADEGEA